MRPLGIPPMPSATSRAIEPVGMTSTGARSSLPRRMTEPLPNWRSICASAVSSAFSRSAGDAMVGSFDARLLLPVGCRSTLRAVTRGVSRQGGCGVFRRIDRMTGHRHPTPGWTGMCTDALVLLLLRSLPQRPNACSKNRPRVEHVFGPGSAAIACAGLAGHRASGAVPARLGYIRRIAEGEPDLTRWHAVGERLTRRAASERGEHEVVHDDQAVAGAELVVDGDLEFAELHRRLPDRRSAGPRTGRSTFHNWVVVSGPSCLHRTLQRARRAGCRAPRTGPRALRCGRRPRA